MNMTKFAIDYDRFIYFLVIALTLFGINSYFNLPKAQDPGFTIRTVAITTHFPGATPQKIEELITDKIEQEIQQMPELDFVSSDSLTGVSVINANFKQEYKEMQPIFDKLRRKVERIQKDLPIGAGPSIVNDEYGDVFGVIYTLTGEGFSYKELKTAADEIRDELLMLDQIAKVEIHGNQAEVIFVEYNNAKLQKLGLSAKTLKNTLQSVNILSSGGEIAIGSERIILEPTGNFESIEDIKRTLISIPNSKKALYLEDIAKVYRGYKDPKQSAVHSSGKPALAIAISMKDGGNILELGKVLKSVMPNIQAKYPHGLELDMIAFQPDLVEKSVNGFMINLAQAIAIVFITMFLFLGLRTGIVVSLIVPSVMLITFVVMELFGVGINKMSLAALIIALGLLVDSGIVMAEGILVRMERGEEKVKAAIATGKEMLVPLLTSALTTSAAFLPILLAKSAVGEFTGDIARVVSIALILSWILALTFIPLLAVGFMRVKIRTDRSSNNFSAWGYRTYRAVLALALKFKYIFLLLVVALFVLSIKGLGLVPKAFIPGSTDPIVNAKFDMPVGTSIEATEAIAYDIERYLQKEWLITKEQAANGEEGILNWMTFIGAGAPRFVLGYDPGSPSTRHIALVANMTDYQMIPDLEKAVKAYTKEKYPDLQVQLKKLGNGPPVDYPISIRVLGKDKEVLYKLVADIKAKLYQMPEVSALNDNWGAPSKKLLVKVNQERARRAGVSSEDVAMSLKGSLTGTDLTQYREGNTLIPVTLRLNTSDRNNLSKLEGTTIYSSGVKIPLKQVADIELAWEAGLIKRRNRLKAITINVQLDKGVTATEVSTILLPWLENETKSWPKGYSYELGGELEASGEAGASIQAVLPLAMMVIILLLIWQFNSIRRPFIILLTIPLGMIGVTPGLIAAGTIFGFFTILGIVSLSGIIINNAIVLLDRIKIEIEENNLSGADAIFEACQQRLRPILLTTATTLGGMLPLWLSRDPMFETMAVAIIFGLLFATILTLIFVPVLYSILFRVSFKGWKYIGGQEKIS